MKPNKTRVSSNTRGATRGHRAPQLGRGSAATAIFHTRQNIKRLINKQKLGVTLSCLAA